MRLHSNNFTAKLFGNNHEHEMRHRRPAQRRQVHSLQRADQGWRRGGKTIPSAPSIRVSVSSKCRTSASPLSEIVKPQRVVPAVTEFVDIAGLVAGASKGEGWATSFWPTSGRPMLSRTLCAASPTTT